MESYKLSALNHFFQTRKLSYRLPCDIKQAYKLVIINGIAIYARIANTHESIQKGLMGVEKLGHNEGCLLCFNSDSHATLWMKNCKMNLQAAMIDKDGIITDIIDMSCKDPNRLHHSSIPVRYALEMPEKFFTETGIKVTDRVRL